MANSSLATNRDDVAEQSPLSFSSEDGRAMQARSEPDRTVALADYLDAASSVDLTDRFDTMVTSMTLN
jgi:hypothetical protein